MLENEISELDIIFELTEPDLKELAVSIGVRKRFIKRSKESVSNEPRSFINHEQNPTKRIANSIEK